MRTPPQLREAIEKDGQIRELIETAKKLEGMVRNSGVHAAGVVISPRPLTDLVPLHRTKNDEIVTAFDMVAIEKLGLLKMDFLGLTTLTILDDALKLIAADPRRRPSLSNRSRWKITKPTKRSSIKD